MESLSLHPSLFLSHILSPSLFPSPFLSHTHILALSFSLTAMHTKTDIHACSHPHIHTPQHTETRTRTYTQARRHTRTRACTHKTVDLCVFSFLKCHEPVLRTGIQSYTNSVYYAHTEKEERCKYPSAYCLD